MGFASFYRKKDTVMRPSSPSSPTSSWTRWPSCKRPRTESFRTKELHEDYEQYEESWFTSSSDDDGYCTDDFSTTTASEDDQSETDLHGLTPGRRLLLDPIGTTSSILEESKAGEGFPFKESVVLVVESKDPYMDFRTSMEEMVFAHRVEDLGGLRELLDWYLKVNGEKTHELIAEAFVDLLLRLSSSSSSSSSVSRCSSSSSCSPRKEIIEETIASR